MVHCSPFFSHQSGFLGACGLGRQERAVLWGVSQGGGRGAPGKLKSLGTPAFPQPPFPNPLSFRVTDSIICSVSSLAEE